MDLTKIAAAFLFLSALVFFPWKTGLCADDNYSLFWPPPPSEMRIAFVKSIYSSRDLGIKPTFFKKLKQLITGQENDSLNKPIAVAADNQGTIYVCDVGSSVVRVFNQKSKQNKIISAVNKEALFSPVGVAVSPNGLIFIADSKLQKIFCLDKHMRFLWSVGGDGSLLRPTGLAADDKTLYVVDTAAHRVLEFDFQGKLTGQFGKRGKGIKEFNFPTAIAIDREGNLYIVDALNFRVQVLDRNQRFLSMIGQIGDSSGSFARPKGVAVDSFGHIYTTDGLSDNIQVFNRDKKFLLSLGESGNRNGEFWIVSGIAIDSNDFIYAADSYNQRLQVFRYVGKE